MGICLVVVGVTSISDLTTRKTQFQSESHHGKCVIAPQEGRGRITDIKLLRYFKNHDPNIPFYHTKDGDIPLTGGSYNRDGRAYPDISAISENGVTITTGGVVRLDNAGTSMAAPIVAALISRINEERLSAGKGLVGFVNPVFYAHPEMFNDITFSPLKVAPCNETGYLEAVKGWDPMTGLGTPNYPAMLEVFMNLK